MLAPSRASSQGLHRQGRWGLYSKSRVEYATAHLIYDMRHYACFQPADAPAAWVSGSPLTSMISRFFIDRPIFASVCSIVITLAGAVAYNKLPLPQFPSITPPTVQVTCNYPGAAPKKCPIRSPRRSEQQVNGVEGIMYMSSHARTTAATA